MCAACNLFSIFAVFFTLALERKAAKKKQWPTLKKTWQLQRRPYCRSQLTPMKYATWNAGGLETSSDNSNRTSRSSTLTCRCGSEGWSNPLNPPYFNSSYWSYLANSAHRLGTVIDWAASRSRDKNLRSANSCLIQAPLQGLVELNFSWMRIWHIPGPPCQLGRVSANMGATWCYHFDLWPDAEAALRKHIVTRHGDWRRIPTTHSLTTCGHWRSHSDDTFPAWRQMATEDTLRRRIPSQRILP